MAEPLRILLIEDVAEDAELLAHVLRKGGFDFSLQRVETEARMLRACREWAPDLILADYKLPRFDGMSALRLAREECPETPYIFVSGHIGEELAVEGLKQGATDYVFKNNLRRLVPVMERALRGSAALAQARQAERAREVHLQRQAELVECSLGILSETTLEGMLATIADVACHVTGGRHAAISYGFTGSGFRHFHCTVPDAPASDAGMLTIDRGGVFLDLLTTEHCVNLTDEALRSHPRWWGVPVGHAPLRGLLGVRLTGADGCATGTLMVTDRTDGQDFTAEDQILLTQLAALASLGVRQLASQKALEQARDELERRVEERTAELTRTVASLQEENTERRKAVEALQRTEERYALAAIGANDGIWDWDVASGKIYFSSRWKRILGYDEYELRNSMDEWSDRIHPGDRGRVLEALENHLAGSLPLYREEYRMRHKDGNYRWVLTRGASFRNAQGKAYRMAGSLSDISEQKLAEAHLLEYQEKLRNLSAHLDAMLEKERKSISREIHDELGQSLTALRFDVKWLANRMPPEQPALEEKFTSMLALIDGTIDTVQRIATELRPRILYDLGLASAIEWHSAQFQKRTGIVCRVEIGCEEVGLDTDRSTALFRIFMEALTNVMRHAEASAVDVALKQTNGQVFLMVRDNGRGITLEQLTDSRSVGIIGMNERAHLWGARVEISGVPGEGTTVTVVMPLVV